MRERTKIRQQETLGDPICVHSVSVYDDCERCDIECGSSNLPELNQTLLISVPCPYCDLAVPIAIQVLHPTEDTE